MSLSNNDTRSQTKQIVYKVYTFLKQLSTKSDITADFFKNTQIRTAVACRLSERTIRCICSEAKEKSEESTSVMSFKSPRKVTNLQKLCRSSTILIPMSLRELCTSFTIDVSTILHS